MTEQISQPADDFILGTVQLGLPYGVANQSGMPSREDAIAIIRRALDLGISKLDTARAYGESEERIGDALNGDLRGHVITKLDPLDGLNDSTPISTVKRAVNSSIRLSCRALARDHLPTLTLHRAKHLSACNGTIWRELVKMRDTGKIGRLGVSVQSPAEAVGALHEVRVSQIQLPFNVLDWRWREAGLPALFRQRKGLIIHVRSTLLQGLLTSDDIDVWPEIDGVRPAEIMQKLTELTERFNRTSVTDLCFAYARAQDWIDGLVVGSETQEQLEANIALFQNAPLTAEECLIVERTMPPVPEQLLDPAQWPLPAQ